MSSLTGLIAGGGGGGGAATGAHSSFFKGQLILLQESQTYTFLKSGTARIIAVGGGGSGAFCYMGFNGSTYNNGFAGACGGGAGGFAMTEDVKVVSGDTLTAVIGAAGITNFGSGNSAWNGGVQVGTAGGTTTVNSSIASGNISLTANGGAGGGLSETGAANGGAGGTGSGGNVNRTGGGGGNIGGNNLRNPTPSNSSNNLICVATGGGSVGIFGNIGFDGGDFNKNSTNTQNVGYGISTGGAGTGGNGGAGNIGNSTFGVGSGGGSNGAGNFSTGNSNITAVAGGVGALVADYPSTQPLMSLDGSGQTANAGSNPSGSGTARSGGGGGGVSKTGGFVTLSGGGAAFFGGGGAASHRQSGGATNFSHSDSVAYGGGGGGFATSTYQGNTGVAAWAKEGGSGIVIIDLIPD